MGVVSRPAGICMAILLSIMHKAVAGAHMRQQAVAFFGLFTQQQAPTVTAQPFTPSGGPGLPGIYLGWFNKEILNQVQSATQAAMKAGVNKQEVIMPALPNMEELDFGTSLNQRFNKEVTGRLKVEDYLVKRSSVAYANLDFSNRLAEGLKTTTYIVGFDGEVLAQGDKAGSMSKFSRLASPTRGWEEATTKDLIVVMSPGVDDQWNRAASISSKTGVPTVALAPPFSLRYDIGHGKGWEVTYCLKRVTRGWIFRCYPGNWKAYLERPDGKFELLQEWKDQPKLNEVSTLLRRENDLRYGVTNDRYMNQRL